jgi:hypothetical protein
VSSFGDESLGRWRIEDVAVSFCLALFPAYRLFATRVPQLKVWHFLVIGIKRNVCRCTFNGCGVITQFAKLESSCVVVALTENYRISKTFKVSPETNNH